MEEVLITGSHGLVGLHVVPQLARSGRVFAVGRSARPSEHENVIPVGVDLSRPLDPAALPERLGAVVWLAQSNRFRHFPEGAEDMFAVNLAQLHGTIEYARKAGAKRFVYASTGSVYAPSDAPLTEDSPTGRAGELGLYAASRLAAELLVGSYKGLMDVAILRFFFVYGRGPKRDMLIPRLVDMVREGRTITLAGEAGVRINPLNARDAAAAVEAALSLSGVNVINVAGPEVLSMRNICDIAGDAAGIEPVYQLQPDARPQDVVADISRMGALLGAPAVTFREGVADLL